MKIRLLLIVSLSLISIMSNSAMAQWKSVPCTELKFRSSVPFTICYHHMAPDIGTRQIWAGAFHDASSSAYIALYTAKRGMRFEGAEKYATEAYAYGKFFQRYPQRSEIEPIGKWLKFPASIAIPGGYRSMNCLQFFDKGPNTPQQLLQWTLIAAMCVKQGEVPESAADLVLRSIQVDLR